ncbi:ABC transporter permease [Flavimobilis marinus]|uniref:Putative ABC transport system permease protein n=1 Tax=Flavimobilis marinus TaxID=285351 RepID=A0A1I2HG10_9MICO|nr:ABC transporter permease [Flavimobilis marinus]GHG57796.1 ABC transporter permease [Flavimobilis marinus]SFF28240.1 putative ABC transport system permease protein [Flavimobilis marinus]
MIRLTLAQMRRSVGRLTAAGIAIALGAAFVAATLLAGNAIQRGTYDALSAAWGKADLVIDADMTAEGLAERDLEAVAALDGVAAVGAHHETYQEVTFGATNTYLYAVATKGDPSLDAQTVSAGRAPAAPGEIALPVSFAERVGAVVGDELAVTIDIWEDEAYRTEVRRVEIVGLLDDPYNAYASQSGAAVATAEELLSWNVNDAMVSAAWHASVAVSDSADTTEVQREIQTMLGAALGPQAQVLTRDEYARGLAAEFTGGEDVMTAVVLGFAALSLLVAGLVISNTFQVLVAQRARTLALLRCVGANKRQLRLSVLLEASLLGLAAGVLGLLVGAGVAQASLSILGSMDLDVPLPAWIEVTPTVVVVPLLASLLVTTIAALAPARAASRTSPLAALRPLDPPTVRSRSGRIGIVISALLILAGIGFMGLGIATTRIGGAEMGLLIAFGGGALSVVGVLVSTGFWVPKVAGAVGRLVARGGPTARLAAANTLRNPRRTAATSTALLIGVTLVVTMSTGAASARSALTAELDSQYPMDVSIEGGAAVSWEDASVIDASLEPTLVEQVAAVEGVDTVAPFSIGLTWDDRRGTITELVGVDPEKARAAFHAVDALADLDDSTVLMVASDMEAANIVEGAATSFTLLPAGPVPTAAADLEAGAEQVTLTVHESDVAYRGPVVTLTTLDRLTQATAIDGAWAGLTEDADEGTATKEIQEAVSESGVYVSGVAVERAALERVIDTMLAIVVGLLAVAVVIALIGVTNTLSLSVIERQRESATLRAIGLTKKQLRSSLAIEGLLITLVGSVLGIALGLAYGWIGTTAALGLIGDVRLAVPWRDLGLVLLVGLAAGLGASVLPARRAVRTSPVEALAVD